MGANDKQVDGSHYRTSVTQHWDWAQHKDYLVGAATKYLDRHREKGGLHSVEKCVHYIQKLVERDYPEYELVFQLKRKDKPEPDYQNPYRNVPEE